MARRPRPVVPAVLGVLSLATVLATVGPGPRAAASTTASSAEAARALCGAAPGRTVGSLADPDLTELSGLAWSRTHRNVLWAHNDSGDGPRVFALARDGSALGTLDVAGADAVDWEDMALGRGPDGADHLFLGDIGGGAAGARSTVEVHRVREPAPPGAGGRATTARAQTINLRYPDEARDAEALLVDDRTGDLVIVAKAPDGPATVFRARGGARAADGVTITLERVGDLARPTDPSPARALAELGGLGGLADRVTAADASADAGIVVVRTYGGVAVHRWPTRRSLADALLTDPCAAPAPTDLRFPQGEAIALSPNGRRYVTVAEGIEAPLVEVRARRP